MNINYKNFKIISSENFVIFKINDFLNKDQYNLLSKCFNKFEVNEIYDKDNLKYLLAQMMNHLKNENIPEIYNLIQEIEKKLENNYKKTFFISEARNLT